MIEANSITRKMGEMGFSSGPNRKTFGTSMSFDLDDAPAPRRRVARRKAGTNSRTTQQKPAEHSGTDCPGCGHELEDGEWLDALIGFISGAHDFELGNPVRARVVQTLRNEVTRMNTPHPREQWELAVTSRLMSEIERIVTAEVNRYHMEHGDTEQVSANQRAEIEAATEARVRNDMVQEIRDEVIAEIRPVMEAQLRREIEEQLWSQFEYEWRHRLGGSA